jgi:hypothetical protein
MFPILNDLPAPLVKDSEYEPEKGWPIEFQSTLDRQAFNWISYHLGQNLRELTESYPVVEELFRLLPTLMRHTPLKPVIFKPITAPLVGTFTYSFPVNVIPFSSQKTFKTRALHTRCLDAFKEGRFTECQEIIRQLQTDNQPVFIEFFYFLSRYWDVLSKPYQEQYGQSLPSLDTMRDQNGMYDPRQFEVCFPNSDFLISCLLSIIENSTMDNYLAYYGLGLECFLQGKFELIREILTDKLHPFDAIFMKYVLSNFMHAAVDGYLVAIDADASQLYLNEVVKYLQHLDDSNFKNFNLHDKLSLEYHRMTGWIYALVTPHDQNPQQGDPCLIRIYPAYIENSLLYSVKDTLQAPQLLTKSDDIETAVSSRAFFDRRANYTFQGKSTQLLDLKRYVSRPLVHFILGIINQVPTSQWETVQSRVGSMLRQIFREQIYWVDTTLTSEEQTLARALLDSPAWHPLYKTLQARHILGLMSPSHLQNQKGVIVPEGVVMLGAPSTKGNKLYQGSHDAYLIRSLIQLNQKNYVNAGLQIGQIYKLWNEQFKLHDPDYEPEIPYCRATQGTTQLRLTPGTSILKQGRTGLMFFPLVIDQEGVYCHLHTGKYPKPAPVSDTTRFISTGTCLLGGDLVGVMNSPSGLIYYNLLEAHSVPPPYPIVDISHQYDEHPEETMFLLMQSTLARFYRDINADKTVILYLHDTRIPYLCYLIPHYLNGLMTLEALKKAVASISERQLTMHQKLQAIMRPYDIEVKLFSSLQSISLDWILKALEQSDAVSAEDKEAAIVDLIFESVIQDANTSAAVQEVYRYIQENLDTFQTGIKEKGLRWLAIIDYVAQNAILNLWSTSPVLVSNQSVEHKLLTNYEKLLAARFHSIIQFLWINPVAIRDDSKHNRLFFINTHIEEMSQFIKEVTPGILRLTRDQALDHPFEVKENTKTILAAMKGAPIFFNTSSDSPESEPKYEGELNPFGKK